MYLLLRYLDTVNDKIGHFVQRIKHLHEKHNRITSFSELNYLVEEIYEYFLMKWHFDNVTIIRQYLDRLLMSSESRFTDRSIVTELTRRIKYKIL